MDNYIQYVIILMERKMENIKIIMQMENYIQYVIILMERKMEKKKNII